MLAMVLILLGSGCKLLNYLFVDFYGYEWSRIMMHHFYEKKEIDNLYLGSSHVFFNLDSELMDELNDKVNFNLATSGQRLSGSYYMLKEALKYHEIEHVYLEMFFELSIAEDEGTNHTWWCSDYMKNSLNKIEYVVNQLPPDRHLESFFPFLRYRSKLFDTEYIKEQITRKSTDAYKSYKYRNYSSNSGMMVYLPDGYCYTDNVLEDEELILNKRGRLSNAPLTEEAKEYLYKIVMLCEENEIELVLFSAPMHELNFLALGNYDVYVEQVEDFAMQYGVPYYDFNLAKGEYFPIGENNMFYDLGHLNAAGADLFTAFFNKVVQGTPEENKEYFYDSYVEKLVHEEGRVHGLICIEENSGKGEKWKVASNWTEGMEYRILLTPQLGETMMVQDFSANPYVVFPKGENGICTVVWRRVDDPDSVTTLEVDY